MDLRNNLFGSGPRGGGAARGPGLPGRSVQQPPPPQQQGGGYDSSRGMPPRPSQYDSYDGRSQGPPPGGSLRGYDGGGYGEEKYGGFAGGSGGQARAPPPQSGGGHRLKLAKVQDRTLQAQYIFGNKCAVSPRDFRSSSPDGLVYIRLTGQHMKGACVVTAVPLEGFPDGHISLSDPQRTWCGVSLMDELYGEPYDPFTNQQLPYAGALDLEIGFAKSSRAPEETPYDQDELADIFIKNFNKQIFAPGQKLLLDIKNVPLALTVKTVTPTDLALGSGSDAPPSSDPEVRGILHKDTSITFFKDAQSPIKLKSSKKRPAANAILAPGFKFEDMGIGGLDAEFSTIFRRAFASRIFPPDIIEKLGIMHVKGMLLYGPPGTGKTLIARQIGKMLNAREPKIINGPEVLNKYVGQSEENIRKLFADAEKEYKEKGDESGLHIIIFDELDAVCKQRGSGAGGGTGVGDSVVNQLLSKLDGVDQLNNILLIGMTNRKDMIDDALLRPGRLEVQVEISLPDEHGRQQILKIHTAKMKENNVMAGDVDLVKLAAMTKNFSGAELSGLVKSATSYAFARHTKAGTTAGISDDVADLKVNQQDFENALLEVKPAYGADDTEIGTAITYGIIHFSESIRHILRDGMLHVEAVRKSNNLKRMSVLLHGPAAAGKTALAAHIAMNSDYPFIKIITPASIVGYRDEMAKKDYIHKVFTDAYKSRLSLLIIDDIERLIEWSPVGPRFSNTILQALLTLLKTAPPKGHRLLILATTSQRHVMEQLDVIMNFDRQIAVPAVHDLRELRTLLEETELGRATDLGQVLGMIREDTGGSENVGVGVKMVLDAADGAVSTCGDGMDPGELFVEQIRAVIRP